MKYQVMDHYDELKLLEDKYGRVDKNSVEYLKLKALNKISKRNRRKLREEIKLIVGRNTLSDF